MSADPVIQVEGLGKRYTLGTRPNERYVALRDVIARSARGLLRRGNGSAATETDTSFWALKDVSFEAGRGEAVGIIGRNGAGKSTLLKVLSRITEPTTGRVRLRGRVASLLEVGTGFHPELTGRENIFLNGAILGMARAEIKAKFDEIVAFAEVEKFLDTPVKRYSSGMYVRLAFAVAAHLEPEILVVDEVLAVGDIAFQKKCLGKMQSVARQTGRTVLFVSHNMTAVSTLCKTAVYLEKGNIVAKGTADEIVALYNRMGADGLATKIENHSLSTSVVLQSLTAEPSPLEAGSPLRLRFTLAATTAEETVTGLCLLLYTSGGQRLGIFDFRSLQSQFVIRPGVPLSLEARLDSVDLVESDYSIGLFYLSATTYVVLPDLMRVNVLPRTGAQDFVPYAPHDRGLVEIAWQPSFAS